MAKQSTMYFRVKAGIHYEKVNGVETMFTKGQIVPSERDLTKVFANKFVRVNSSKSPVSVEEDEEGEEYLEEEQLPVPARLSKTEEDEDEEDGDSESKDVTDLFPDALKKEVTVFLRDEKYWVYENSNLDTPLNSQGFTMAKVKSFIKKEL